MWKIPRLEVDSGELTLTICATRGDRLNRMPGVSEIEPAAAGVDNSRCEVRGRASLRSDRSATA